MQTRSIILTSQLYIAHISPEFESGTDIRILKNVKRRKRYDLRREIIPIFNYLYPKVPELLLRPRLEPCKTSRVRQKLYSFIQPVGPSIPWRRLSGKLELDVGPENEALVTEVVAVFKAQRQELKCSGRGPGYFALMSDKAPPAARNDVGVWAVAYPCR